MKIKTHSEWFLNIYIIQVYLFYVFTNNSYVTLIYFLSLIPFGNFALNYHNSIISYLREFRMFRVFSRRSDIINDLNPPLELLRLYAIKEKSTQKISEFKDVCMIHDISELNQTLFSYSGKYKK